jgi:hypothetical protein
VQAQVRQRLGTQSDCRKTLDFCVAFLRRFDRRHAIVLDSAKTYGNPARRTGAKKRVSLRCVLKRQLSVVFWLVRENV